MEEKEFLNKIKKVSGKRDHKITNSYGVYDAFKYYRKERPANKKFRLSESQYFSIIRRVNNYLRDSLCEGNDIVFPRRLGKIEVRKYLPKITIEGKEVKTNLPIDWDATLKLWYNDKEAYDSRFLVRAKEEELFKINYNKEKAIYNNQSFYQFSPNREMKLKLKRAIKSSKFDAFTNIYE